MVYNQEVSPWLSALGRFQHKEILTRGVHRRFEFSGPSVCFLGCFRFGALAPSYLHNQPDSGLRNTEVPY